MRSGVLAGFHPKGANVDHGNVEVQTDATRVESTMRPTQEAGACRWSRVHRAPKVVTRSAMANRCRITGQPGSSPTAYSVIDRVSDGHPKEVPIKLDEQIAS